MFDRNHDMVDMQIALVQRTSSTLLTLFALFIFFYLFPLLNNIFPSLIGEFLVRAEILILFEAADL